VHSGQRRYIVALGGELTIEASLGSERYIITGK
jgi:hypothetical protein